MLSFSISIQAFRVALHYMGETDIDTDEVHCILANLIYEGHIKGYISLQHQKLIISKQNPFPSFKKWLCQSAFLLFCPHNFRSFPANTRRCFDVDSTSFERYGRQMDVETTLCAYWVYENFLLLQIFFANFLSQKVLWSETF